MSSWRRFVTAAIVGVLLAIVCQLIATPARSSNGGHTALERQFSYAYDRIKHRVLGSEPYRVISHLTCDGVGPDFTPRDANGHRKLSERPRYRYDEWATYCTPAMDGGRWERHRHPYDAYGTGGPFSVGTNSNPYAFAGERTDGSGLQWLRARFYNPGAGSFTVRDRFPGNPYAYAAGNPVRFRDPSGHLTSYGEVMTTVESRAEFQKTQTAIDVAVANKASSIIGWAIVRHIASRAAVWALALGPEVAIGAYGAGAAAGGSGGTYSGPVPAPQPGPMPGAEPAPQPAAGGAISGGPPGSGCDGGVGTDYSVWPETPERMDDILGFKGQRLPDSLNPPTPGRNKVVWKPASNVTITYEQHPYHANAPDFHRLPHWHLDSPAGKHVTYAPGEKIPGC